MGGASRPSSASDQPWLVVAATTPAYSAAATLLAERLGAPLLEVTERPVAGDALAGHGAPVGALLEVSGAGLALVAPSGARITAAEAWLRGKALPGADLLGRALLSRRGGGPPSVVDATAGLGADGFHLAVLGHRVEMLEREPVLVVLLEDVLERARAGLLGVTAADAARRISLTAVDARQYLADRPKYAEIVYLDPMFPPRKGGALPPKGMALLREVLRSVPETAEREGAELLSAALAAAERRVVVKRATRSAPLAGRPPSGSIEGRSVRYDLYAPVKSGAGSGGGS